VTRLVREAGVIAADETPSDDELRRFDKGRKDKKVGNAEWVSTTDEDLAWLVHYPRVKNRV
jgi:hypothetical protein